MARTRKRWLYPLLGTAIAVIAYLYGLNSIHIPNIGDESRYIQIARMTASSGSMLPLISERGIDNTKPPMLFWQGILTTAQGKKWTPLHLRVPIVFYSFAIAVLVGFLSWKISGASLTGWLAGFIYLGFMSTIQQGRPFLTNAPETFFLFLPLIIVFFKKRLNSAAVIACGLSLGAAALYKSFFLVFVGVIALAAVYLHREDWKLRRFFRTSALPLIVTGLIGLAVFSLWFLLDPNPELIFKQFVLGENAGKFSPADFVTGLFSGSYPVWRIWLGNFANAGFYAPLLIALVIDAVKRRGTLSKEKKRLWVYIAAILAVYTFPTQRQENYILPTTAALSVLLALRWRALASGWFRASFALIGVFLAASLWAQYQINLTFDDRLFDIFNYAAV
ncbi:MAG: hypothetical protein U9R36_05120, partial [Elusimicrobiota bacterium]|nr:hypothetical protein [Elusimicrobiota bacterium]